MPDITAKEKVDMMKIMGTQVHISPKTSMADKEKKFFHVARRLAEEIPNAYCPNQFDTGTAGTIAGISTFLKEQNADIKVWLIDPEETAAMDVFINNSRSTSMMEDGFEMVPMAKDRRSQKEWQHSHG
ncbi:hypothetical protein PsorP6_017534 [Peronosclerospora sorghi]|uniref:Uncharacterized protein n=1 Tax=Peronosclerospora sorghi TaxID=230839 RepID=A0ACC0WLI5_9STRA|nr:hypothetical protein PsorP6_017534 [Peronosclerospora sorghi]